MPCRFKICKAFFIIIFLPRSEIQHYFESFSLSTTEDIISNKHEITIKFDFESGVSSEFKTEQL